MSGFLGVPTATAANTYLTNPLGFAYSAAEGATYAKLRYSRPTGMVVAGRCNRYDQGFADARAAGAEVLAYLNPMERPDSPICSLDTGFYGGDLSRTPLWPYPTYGQRVHFANQHGNHHMTDLRAGSPWVLSVVAYIENLMREDRVDGVFIDAVGARLWSTLANWDSWPQWERDKWTEGAVDLMERLDAKRRAINPRFIIVNNNVWDLGNETPPRALDAEQYVDGICIEVRPLSDYTRRIAGKPYGNLGHRRVLVVANSATDPQDWAGVQGITHVSDQFDYYGIPSPPPIPFNRLTDRPKRFGRTDIAANTIDNLTAHQKRGSKFTLTQKGTLLRFATYLDGQGGASGSQVARMALYRDNAGLPGALVAQSGTVTVTAGSTARWQWFSAPAVPLDPGAYWIVLHTGDTQDVISIRGDGSANWYASVDQFADGPSNPFGTGWSGNPTLSLNVYYTVG